jgi:hypothetical protein
MSKQSRAPTVAALIDRHSRSLAAMRNRLLVERDPERLAHLREDIVVKESHIGKLKSEQTNENG